MIVVSGAFEFKADAVDAAKAAMANMMVETHKEAGCIVYEFTQDIAQPHKFRVYEEWESDAHLADHAAAAHMGVFRAALKDIIVSRDVKKIEAGAVTGL